MSQKKSQLEPTGAARPRTASAQFLNNKEFAYLLDENKEDTLASPTSPTTIKITPALLNGNNNNKTKNKNNKSNKKDRFNKPRTSSIQVETTKTQNEQLNAIKKEVEFLRSEVPHFETIYNNSQQQWIISKRNKADVEAFALIQSLTEWIHKFGNKAVKEYDEFKASAEKEIISMVSKMEGLTHENTKLNLLIEEADTEKEELNNKIEIAERDIIKYKKTEQELKTKQQTNELNNNTVTDLENELLLIKQKNKTLTEKYERVEKYWKMTQDENDELRNRNYSMDDEINQLTSQLKVNKDNLQVMDMKHQKTLKNLELEHQNYAQQMQNEQEKLIQAQHQANNSAEQMQSLNTAYNIDADDEDIGGSGITDDNDEYTDGGIVSLGDEINVYEYEDDEWLDETDSDYDDDEEETEILLPEPEPEESEEEEEEEEEEYNKQIEFITVKESYYLDIKYSDISKGFKSIKQWTMNEDKTNNFEMAKQTLSKENKLHAINEKKEEEKEIFYNQFESEKIKIEVESKPNNKSLGLSMSKTAVSHTPQMSGPMDDFQSIKIKSEVENRNNNKNMEFSSAKTGIMAKENELKQPSKPIIYNKIVHIEKGKDNKMIMGGRNFAERLAMFKHMADTKGGKPEILHESKAYALVNKWKDKNKNNSNKGISSVINSIGNEEQMDINKNIHVTKSTVHSVGDSHIRGQTVNVLKITKTKSHKLKPRLFGYMNIIRSSFIPKWKLTTQKPRYFFVLDGLPSETNINSREPDFAKNRQHDFLVPTLFFFKDKDDYDIFYKQVCDLPTRQIKFQKLFAKYAKGIFPLNQYAMEINVSNCMKRVNKLKNKQNDRIKLPINEINECGDVNELTILLCNDKQIHKFQCTDKFSRNKWIKKVNKLVDKRANRLININNGLLGVQNNNNQKLARKSVTEDIDDEQNNNNDMYDGMNTPMGRASIIGNVKSRGYSNNLNAVEPGFD